MIVGCYYRCPIEVEAGDKNHPRFYVLAQVVEYNEIADAVKTEMHDLLGSGEYYGDLFRRNLFFAQDVTRCEAAPGGVVEGSWGRGTIISRASEPYAEDQPYWYWVKLPNGKCVKACEYDAVKVENFCAKVDYDKCIGCGKCHEACPVKAIDVIELGKIALKSINRI